MLHTEQKVQTPSEAHATTCHIIAQVATVKSALMYNVENGGAKDLYYFAEVLDGVEQEIDQVMAALQAIQAAQGSVPQS